MLKFLKDRKKKDNKGFTLVELVIVVAILAILVGILAPQYTKYVEKSRKAADASNMDEMVRVVQVFAADPANENDFEVGKYRITIPASGKTTITKDGTGNLTENGPLKTAMKDAMPKWESTVTKSKKWGTTGGRASIIAVIEVKPDGGTSVSYITSDNDKPENKFATYMQKGDAEKSSIASK